MHNILAARAPKIVKRNSKYLTKHSICIRVWYIARSWYNSFIPLFCCDIFQNYTRYLSIRKQLRTSKPIIILLLSFLSNCINVIRVLKLNVMIKCNKSKNKYFWSIISVWRKLYFYDHLQLQISCSFTITICHVL